MPDSPSTAPAPFGSVRERFGGDGAAVGDWQVDQCVSDLAFDGLTVLGELGRGGASVVFLATDRVLERRVAVKVLDLVDLPSFTRPIRIAPVEARMQAVLSWHSNVLSLYRSGWTGEGHPYLVLEHAQLGSLDSIIRSDGPLELHHWFEVASGLASALCAAHVEGIAHCDVKPSNALCAQDGSVRLADFGIARAADIETRTIDDIRGSLMFAPPELLDGARPDERSDVWSLGLTLWFALTGRDPFSSRSLAGHLAQLDVTKPSFVGSQLDTATVELLELTLSIEPELRPRMDELVDILTGDAQDQRAVPSRVPSDAVATALAASTAARRAIFEELIADLSTLSAGAFELSQRMLHHYPRRNAAAYRQVLDVAVESGIISDDEMVTDRQLRNFCIADLFRSMGGADRFAFDGDCGEFDPVRVPGEVREAARVISIALEWAVNIAPQVRIGLVDLKDEMARLALSRLSNKQMLDDFAGDPRSLDVFDAETVMLMLATARNYFNVLITGREDWLVRFLEKHSDVRSVFMCTAPSMLLGALATDVEQLAAARERGWGVELAAGVTRLSAPEQAAIRGRYEEELRALGVEI